jgi:hypothetical protein
MRITVAIGSVVAGASLAGCARETRSPNVAVARSSVLALPPPEEPVGEIAACPAGSHPVLDLCVADGRPIPQWEPRGNGDPCEGLQNCDPQVDGDPDTDLELGAIVRTLADAQLDLEACKTPSGPRGAGRVIVTFAATGAATKADVVSAPYAGTPTGACVAARFRKVKVPDFKRRPAITVTTPFTIQ